MLRIFLKIIKMNKKKKPFQLSISIYKRSHFCNASKPLYSSRNMISLYQHFPYAYKMLGITIQQNMYTNIFCGHRSVKIYLFIHSTWGTMSVTTAKGVHWCARKTGKVSLRNILKHKLFRERKQNQSTGVAEAVFLLFF